MKKKILSVLLAFCMVLSLLPAAALAAELPGKNSELGGSYSVYFNANDTDIYHVYGLTNDTNVIEMLEVFEVPTPTQEGYTFVGWNWDKDATEALDTYDVTQDTTLYAIWKDNNPGGDTGSGDTGSGDTGSGDTGSGDTGSGDTGSAGGSTGGGSTGGGSSSSGTTTETTKNPDGSTTTTTTDKTTGTVTETTKNTDGSTTVVETAKDGTVTETVTTTDGVSGTVVTNAEGTVTEVTAEVPASADGNNVTLPLEVTAASSAADAVEIDVNVSSSVSNVTVTIPVEDVTPGTVLVLVHEDGTEEVVPKTLLTEDGLAIKLDGSATLKVVDNTKTFNDTKGHWGGDAINFVTSRELFNGVGNDDFAPEQTMNRAMLATVLWRLEGKQNADVNGAFSDVESGTWYTDAVNWAANAGIINGYGDSYGTNDPITREQMVTILYRLNGSPAVSSSVEGASAWAADAMAWAVEIGLLLGDGNGLNPQGTATRAQVSTILMRYMGL